MKLLKILKGLDDYLIVQGDKDIDINKIEYNSTKISDGDMFVCIRGFKTDGHKYINDAIKKGARAIICEEVPKDIKNLTIIKTNNSRKLLAFIACNFYDEPSKKLNIIGVTGTNGKTTTTYLIKSILDNIKHKVGIIGTIENRIGDEIIHTERTTPESLELQKLIDEMYNKGCNDVVMEVSSHSLDLYRVSGIDYDIAIFTNLTQDHLDYHKTMENYKIAKSILFEHSKVSVINIDDNAGNFMIEKSKGKIITYAIDKEADLRAENIHISSNGVKFTLDYKNQQYLVSLNTPGRFSIYNALGAIGACLSMNIDMCDIIKGLNEVVGVKGRFQTLRNKKGFSVIVDYAHTPDGLENILKTAKEFTKGKIITIFGCGGDRDKTKRPIMGNIAGKLSNFCVITSDNPRTENPQTILDEIEVGTKETNCNYIKIVDRREAINYAISIAKENDSVILAGKGHEDYQIFKDETIHFDDVEEVKKAFGEDLQ